MYRYTKKYRTPLKNNYNKGSKSSSKARLTGHGDKSWAQTDNLLTATSQNDNTHPTASPHSLHSPITMVYSLITFLGVAGGIRPFSSLPMSSCVVKCSVSLTRRYPDIHTSGSNFDFGPGKKCYLFWIFASANNSSKHLYSVFFAVRMIVFIYYRIPWVHWQRYTYGHNALLAVTK